MYKVEEEIKKQSFNKLQLKKLTQSNPFEVLSVSLEKNAIFPEHSSPSDAFLVVLEGKIDFHINENHYSLCSQEYFSFPKEVSHWVQALENSKFLIIR